MFVIFMQGHGHSGRRPSGHGSSHHHHCRPCPSMDACQKLLDFFQQLSTPAPPNNTTTTAAATTTTTTAATTTTTA